MAKRAISYRHPLGLGHCIEAAVKMFYTVSLAIMVFIQKFLQYRLVLFLNSLLFCWVL